MRLRDLCYEGGKFISYEENYCNKKFTRTATIKLALRENRLSTNSRKIYEIHFKHVTKIVRTQIFKSLIDDLAEGNMMAYEYKRGVYTIHTSKGIIEIESKRHKLLCVGYEDVVVNDLTETTTQLPD